MSFLLKIIHLSVDNTGKGPRPYFTNPSLFMGKNWTPLYFENFENYPPPQPPL